MVNYGSNQVWNAFVKRNALSKADVREFIEWAEATYSENVFLTPTDRLNDLLQEWTEKVLHDEWLL